MKNDEDIGLGTLGELKGLLHELNNVNECTAKKHIKAIAYRISEVTEEYYNIDRPLYDDATYLGTLKWGTREEIMKLVNRIRRGLQGLVDYIEN